MLLACGRHHEESDCQLRHPCSEGAAFVGGSLVVLQDQTAHGLDPAGIGASLRAFLGSGPVTAVNTSTGAGTSAPTGGA